MVQKAVACVVRDTLNGPKLLVFTHPAGMVQIPKGGVDPGESLDQAVLRELEEESGLRDAVIDSVGPRLTRRVPQGPQGAGPEEDQTWHLFRLHPSPRTPERWQHTAYGSDVEDGLVFVYEWVALADARDALHPLYHPVVDALLGDDGWVR